MLVIDGGASLRCALVGGNLAALGAKNGWAGIVIDGCVRDLAELAASADRRPRAGAAPETQRQTRPGAARWAVRLQGVMVRPGDWIVADADGVIVLDKAPS